MVRVRDRGVKSMQRQITKYNWSEREIDRMTKDKLMEGEKEKNNPT